MDHVLVVGGAGYIGSHSCKLLAAEGFLPVVYDSLVSGHREFIRFGPHVIGDLHDEEQLVEAMRAYRPVAIVHCAALIEVADSLRDPLRFYRNNLGGTLALLSAAERCGVDRLVFSSTCSTYGTPRSVPIDENHPQAPTNPYGQSKHMVERIIADLGAARGLRSVVLRYFNAAGADLDGELGEWHEPETHAIPLAIDAVRGRRPAFRIFGTDYETRDGTCVRDFVHVMDLADAHLRSVRHLLAGGDNAVVNLGSGTGTSIGELVEMVGMVSGRPVPVERAGRRPGDLPVLVANIEQAAALLGWRPRHDLASIVQTAWRWHTSEAGQR